MDIKMGSYVDISGFSENTPTKIKRRLLDLGFTNGQKIRTIRKSALGKDFMVEIRNFILTLRWDLLKYILVE